METVTAWTLKNGNVIKYKGKEYILDSVAKYPLFSTVAIWTNCGKVLEMGASEAVILCEETK